VPSLLRELLSRAALRRSFLLLLSPAGDGCDLVLVLRLSLHCALALLCFLLQKVLAVAAGAGVCALASIDQAADELLRTADGFFKAWLLERGYVRLPLPSSPLGVFDASLPRLACFDRVAVGETGGDWLRNALSGFRDLNYLDPARNSYLDNFFVTLLLYALLLHHLRGRVLAPRNLELADAAATFFLLLERALPGPMGAAYFLCAVLPAGAYVARYALSRLGLVPAAAFPVDFATGEGLLLHAAASTGLTVLIYGATDLLLLVGSGWAGAYAQWKVEETRVCYLLGKRDGAESDCEEEEEEADGAEKEGGGGDVGSPMSSDEGEGEGAAGYGGGEDKNYAPELGGGGGDLVAPSESMSSDEGEWGLQ
jgi:hypothetical protein